MEAFLAFDPHNYPFLVDCNSRFLDVLSRIACKNHLLSCDSKEAAKRLLLKSDNEDLTNILVLVFAPYVASLRVLGHQPLPPLLCDLIPGSHVSFVEYLDHVVLHVTDSSRLHSKHDCKSVSHPRSLYYFVELLKLAFGSCPSAARTDHRQRDLVLALHRHWTASYAAVIYLFEVSGRFVSCS